MVEPTDCVGTQTLKENFVMVSRWIIICMWRKFNRLLFCCCNKWLCNRLFVSVQACGAWTTVISTLLGADYNSTSVKGSIMASGWFGCWKSWLNYLLEGPEKHADTTNSDWDEHNKLSHATFLEGISIETKWTSLLIGSYAIKFN